MRTLILGIGNLLLCDEGVGVHAARALQREDLPSHIITLDHRDGPPRRPARDRAG